MATSRHAQRPKACQSVMMSRIESYEEKRQRKVHQQHSGCIVLSHSWTRAFPPDATSGIRRSVYTIFRYCHLVLLQYSLLVLLVAGCSSVSCARSCRCYHFTAHKSAEAAATKVELIGPYLSEARVKPHRSSYKNEAARVQNRTVVMQLLGPEAHGG